MTTLELEERDLIIDVPDHWDEMTPAQIRYTLHSILSQAHATTPDALIPARIRIFYRLARIRRTWRTILWEHIRPQTHVLEKNTNIRILAEQCTQFIFTQPKANGQQPKANGQRPTANSQQLELNFNSIRNHFPLIRPRPWAPPLHGPADLLADITFGEFRAALEELDEYFREVRDPHTTPAAADHQFARFLACLYRPRRRHHRKAARQQHFDGHTKQPFNRNHIHRNTRHTARIHPVHRHAILLWFTYTIHYIQTEEITISGRTISLRPLFPPPPKDTPTDTQQTHARGSWTSILYTIAKEGVFGSAQDTDNTGLFDILSYMYDQYQENKRLKTQRPTAKGQ